MNAAERQTKLYVNIIIIIIIIIIIKTIMVFVIHEV